MAVLPPRQLLNDCLYDNVYVLTRPVIDASDNHTWAPQIPPGESKSSVCLKQETRAVVATCVFFDELKVLPSPVSVVLARFGVSLANAFRGGATSATLSTRITWIETG